MRARGLDVQPNRDGAPLTGRGPSLLRSFRALGTPLILGRVAGLCVVTVATLVGWMDLPTLALFTAIAVSLGVLEVRSLRSPRSAALRTNDIDTAA